MTFSGSTLSVEGYQVDHSIIDAITDFHTTPNQTDPRSFFGLFNQLSSSNNTIGSLLTPLCPLLSTRNYFLWLPDHQQLSQLYIKGAYPACLIKSELAFGNKVYGVSPLPLIASIAVFCKSLGMHLS